jgi:two-component system cell cycle response regulator
MARILVIEDNPANLELVRYLLEHAGHRVDAAVDGVGGVAAVAAAPPDLVVCDLQLPLLDGYGVLRALRAEPAHAALPVIAVTAFSMPDDRKNVMVAGFDGYLSKPIEPETFVVAIEAFLPPALRLQSPGPSIGGG